MKELMGLDEKNFIMQVDEERRALSNYFQFLRFAMNPGNQSLPDIERFDWDGFFRFATEQAISGVAFEGVKILGDQGMKPPFKTLMESIAIAVKIEEKNNILNSECVRLTKLFEAEGHKTVILKGQANGRLYPNPLSRQPGDKDRGDRYLFHGIRNN